MINSYNKPEYFFGVVEDREDPKRLGRVRVRVFGLHPFEKVQGDFTGLPTEELPWMQVIQSPQSPSIGGIGQAPAGPLPGTHVVGLFLDKYKIDGLVMGTYYADQTNTGVEGEGFRDGTGTYPQVKGNGTPSVAQGGTIGGASSSVVLQSNTSGYGVNPSQAGPNSGDEDDNPNYDLATMLKGDEGVRLKYYHDSLGYPTIGIGHLILRERTNDQNKINKILSDRVGRTITNGQITMEEVNTLFKRDIAITKNAMLSNPTVGPVWMKMNTSRKMALENMAFQLGVGGLAKFKTTLSLLMAGEYDEAYTQARKSLWAKQTPGRANRVSLVLKHGNLESYGVQKSKERIMAMSAPIAFNSRKSSSGNLWDDFLPRPTVPTIDLDLLEAEPETEYVEPDSRIMFVEPESAYQGEYPYVQSTVTEGGHTTEYDNTPGKERFRYLHPSGTYTEVGGSGQKVNRVIGDNYNIYKSNDNVLIEGDGHVVINGNNKVYILGNESNTIDGKSDTVIHGNITLLGSQNIDIIIEGDSTVNIKGDSTVNVEGNSIVTIKGNADVLVEGNGTSTYSGSYKQIVKGDMTTEVHGKRVDTVKGPWNRKTTGDVEDTTDGNLYLDGVRIDFGR